MDFHLLRVYFKAGVLIPFYLSLGVAITFLLPRLVRYDFNWEMMAEDEYTNLMLQIPFFSGIIGMCTLSAFLNLYPRIANHLVYSLLSWMLLPYGSIAYLLSTEVDWTVMRQVASPEMAMTTILVVVCFFHIIGIIITYIYFRRTIVRRLREQSREFKLKDMPQGEVVEERIS